MKLSIRQLYLAVALKGALLSSTFFEASAMNMDTMLMGQNLEDFLTGINASKQHKSAILKMAAQNMSNGNGGGNGKENYRDKGFATKKAKSELTAYLYESVGNGSMQKETAERIASTLSLGGLFPPLDEPTSGSVNAAATPEGLYGPASADYVGEGNIVRLGRLLPSGVPSTSSSFVNGIWGWSNVGREYAFQTSGYGLSILDVTDPTAPFRVQGVPMSGGGYWRDACTHTDEVSGITYLYVASQGTQGGGRQPNLFVFDLSFLSDDPNSPDAEDSDPIPSNTGYKDLGWTGYGHTINCGRGLLFLNTHRSGDGCYVFDLTEDPWNPKLMFNTGGQGDCHDSSVRTGVNVSGEIKDIWITSDGSARRDRIRDITNVDAQTTSPPPIISQTQDLPGSYVHSSNLSPDNQFLFQCDEFNAHDIAVFDVRDMTAPVLISQFQYSGSITEGNARVHNGFVKGKYYFVAYYEAGLRVFDVSNPFHAHEVGKVESWRDPEGTGSFSKTIGSGYDGAWNVHVNLPSGVVLFNDMYEGTYTVRANAPYAKPEAPSVLVLRNVADDVTVIWGAVDNARGYHVERSFDNVQWTRIAEYLISTSFLDSVEPRGLNAYYKLKAFNGEGEEESQTVLSVAGEVSPTFSPTAGPPCTSLTVEILTDTYPSETTWSLVGSCNGYSKVGGPYQAQGTQYDFDDCVPFDEYTFTINDSFGDGIFSPGGYTVTYNSEIVASGNDFGSQDVNVFGSCSSDPPMNAPTTSAPTGNPISAPTPGATIDKYICRKNKPLDSSICADGQLAGAGGICSAAGQPDGCGNGGKTCWWASCPSGAPVTAAPTNANTPPPAPSPTPPPVTCPVCSSTNAQCCAPKTCVDNGRPSERGCK